jgi:hypothetical protein
MPARVVAIAVVSAAVALGSAHVLGAQNAASAPAAGTANPELVGALASEIGATPQQAEGAAGAMLSLAKDRLQPDQFAQVRAAVPGIDGLLKAAPAMTGAAASPTDSALSQLPGGNALGGLSALAGPFSKLGLKPELALKAAPVLTKYVGKTGGPQVASLLAGVLK